MRIDAHSHASILNQRTRSTLNKVKVTCTGTPVCVSMRAQTGALGRTQYSHLPYKHQSLALHPCRPGVAKALANDRGHGNGDGIRPDGMARLFTQHKLLMGSGFSYDQASLILQVSQQRKAASQLLASGREAPPCTAEPVTMHAWQKAFETYLWVH